MNNNEVFLAVISITLLVLLLVSGVIITFFVSGQRRIKHQMVLAQNKLSFEQELRQVETEVSEHMMGQFAQELHDNIGQLLTAMHIQIENQKLDFPDLTESFKPIEIYHSEITQQLRLLSRTLNNDHIGHIGLLSSLQLEIDRLNTLKRVIVHCKPLSGISNLNKKQELMVFRIFQEITQNVLKHSSAKNIYITVNNQNENFELHVKDDGKGFDFEKVYQTQRASGIKNIVKRAQLANLLCELKSTEGNGCSILIKKLVSNQPMDSNL